MGIIRDGREGGKVIKGIKGTWKIRKQGKTGKRRKWGKGKEEHDGKEG